MEIEQSKISGWVDCPLETITIQHSLWQFLCIYLVLTGRNTHALDVRYEDDIDSFRVPMF